MSRPGFKPWMIVFVSSTALGLIAAIASTHGPRLFSWLVYAFIPPAPLVVALTGKGIGESTFSLALFILLQLVYCFALVALVTKTRKWKGGR